MRFIWPIDDHYITRGFSYQSSIYIGGQHAAVDLVRLYGDTAGRDIKATADGVVVGDAWDPYSGYFIVLEHADGWRTTYRHLVTDAPPVVGQQMVQGQTIGNVGSTGLSTGPHLHFDLWHRQKQDDTAFSKNGWWAHNPELYLGQEDGMALTLEERIAAHDQYHRETIDPNIRQLNDRTKNLEGFRASHERYHRETIDPNIRQLNDRVKNLEAELKALKAAGGGDGLKRGDTVKLT